MKEIVLKKEIVTIDRGNGFYSIKSPVGDRIANSEAKFIIDCIVNGSDINTILNKLNEMNDKSFLSNKKYLFNFLSELKFLKFLDFDQSLFDDLISKNSLGVSGESTYTDISKTIINALKNEKQLYSKIDTPRYYNVISLRMRSFSNNEVIFFRERNFNNIIGISNLHIDAAPVEISLILCADENSITELFDLVENKLKEFNKFKIRIVLNDKKIEHSRQLLNLLDAWGFQFEATLIKENRVDNFILYYKEIN